MDRAHTGVVERLAAVSGIDAIWLDQAMGAHTYEHFAPHVHDIERWRRQPGDLDGI